MGWFRPHVPSPNTSAWEPWEIDLLKSLIAQTVSLRRIQRVYLPHRSLGAVMRRRKMLGLEIHTSPGRPKQPKKVSLALPLPFPPSREGARDAVLSLGDDQCAWPIGDPRAPSFTFCGEPRTSDWGPWCDRHSVTGFSMRRG